MDERMKQFAENGDINAFYQLIREDVKLLEHIDELPFVDTPLHIAASTGRIPFALEMMGLKPSFARKLNQNGFSPIHLALQNGHIELVRRLLQIDGDLVQVKGRERLTPLHYIVQSGKHHDLLEEFLLICPDSIVDVTGRNETALHIALKYNRLEVFKFLVTWLGVIVYKNAKLYQRTVLNWKDDEGNTVLHIAVSKNQSEAVRHLLAWGYNFVDVNHKNLKGKTAWDIVQPQGENGENRDILQGQTQVENRDILQGQTQVEIRDILQVQPQVKNGEIRDMLRRARAKSGSSVSTFNRYEKYQMLPESSGFQFLETDFKREIRKLSEERRSMLLVVAVLLVTVSYQAVLNPPGGLWQDDGKCFNTTEVGSSPNGTVHMFSYFPPGRRIPPTYNKTENDPTYLTLFNSTLACEHKAGAAIAFEDGLFQVFLACNAIIFLISNSLIIFLVPNGYMKGLFFALNVTLCFSYSYAQLAIAGDPYRAYMAGILTTISALFIFVAQLFSWKQ
ncbi:ankyrin repeat-containing protein BDA1-like [Quercus robur]|uniref:ankyrin repeat-containing protein BDA1-like n=1 Tax=Quercus robur TaxID=38942 RepID=UPI002161A671|nr:ankyrin repeat-containing protein BDA1-like [Quercus robur]